MRAKQPVVILMAVLLIFSAGCKSSKKAREAAALKARQEQELALRNQRDAEQKAREEKLRAEEANRELEEKVKANAKVESAAPAQKVEQYFTAISSSANIASANTSINEALGLFASDQTPVLIVISEQDGQKDYDKPTTIKNYLNYLKDQRKNPNRVGNLQLDNAGKIKELELVKDR